MDIYAVIGNPVMHSKSPKIHSMFAQSTDQTMEYSAIQAPLDGFQTTVAAFFEGGGKGANVTVPFKEQAWALVSRCSSRAESAGAVNTLYMQDGELYGDNTDGIGLLRDLTVNNAVEIADKRVLVLGAGGAVRGVLLPLLEQQPGEVVIANRTLAKAESLVALFNTEGTLSASPFEDLRGSFDLIINGTSASLAGDLPPIPSTVIGRGSISYDMMYSQQMTIFNQWAQDQGADKSIDGLGMLVEQAAEAFYLWRGVRPSTDGVMQSLRLGD